MSKQSSCIRNEPTKSIFSTDILFLRITLHHSNSFMQRAHLELQVFHSSDSWHLSQSKFLLFPLIFLYRIPNCFPSLLVIESLLVSSSLPLGTLHLFSPPPKCIAASSEFHLIGPQSVDLFWYFISLPALLFSFSLFRTVFLILSVLRVRPSVVFSPLVLSHTHFLYPSILFYMLDRSQGVLSYGSEQQRCLHSSYSSIIPHPVPSFFASTQYCVLTNLHEKYFVSTSSPFGCHRKGLYIVKERFLWNI